MSGLIVDRQQPNSSTKQDFLIGRQPIFDRQLRVIGYELLFRSLTGSISDMSGDLATTHVILNAFSEIGLQNLVGDGLAFINCTRSFLTGKLPFPLPASRSVLEVLEDITIDKQLVDSLNRFAHSGYTIALDDVVSFQHVEPLLGLARVVKIDLPKTRHDDLPELVREFKAYGTIMLAEKVETQKEYEYCKRCGFDYFQGYFFSKPAVIRGSKVDQSRMVVLHALSILQDPNCNFQMLEDVISRDVSLSYKLLKLVNSAYYAQNRLINSISQTVGVIGITQLSGWLTLMLMNAVDNKPHELTRTAMMRAKLCELLGKRLGARDTNMLFMVGLFSVLDALFDTTMQQVLTSLSIAPEVEAGLLRREGEGGFVLSLVEAIERGDWELVLQAKIPADLIRSSYLQALDWTNQIIISTEKALQAAE